MSWTIAKVLNWTKNYFEQNKIDTARLDAELIISYVLKIKKIELYTQPEKILKKTELDKIHNLIKRRIKKEPIAYIIGYKHFYRDKFKVTQDVLIPRPETEFIVEAIEKMYPTDAKFSLLDIGTGSGNLAVSLQKIFPNAQITASDINEKALDLARENEKKILQDAKINFVQSDIFDKIQDKYDIIISNPPYIPQTVYETLEDNVRLYEPQIALIGGEDGLDFYKKFFREFSQFITQEGHVFLEIGVDIIDSVQEIIPDNFSFSFIPDYNQIPRILHLNL